MSYYKKYLKYKNKYINLQKGGSASAVEQQFDYDGYIEKDKIKSGYCSITYPVEDKDKTYRGNFNEISGQLPDGIGQGLFEFNNGTYYGQFENKMFNGIGKFIYKDKSIYTGKFENDAFHGEGKLIYSNGLEANVSYTNGKINIIKKSVEKVESLDTYELILLVSSHGCDVKNQKLKFTKDFCESIEPFYINKSDHGCLIEDINGFDIMHAYDLFNNKDIINPINKYQLKTREVIKPDNIPKYEHYFEFGIIKSELNNFDGIFIIKNNIGLPTLANLFDWKQKNYINNDETVKSLSLAVVKYIKHTKYLPLSSLFSSVYEWFKQSEFKDKKLKLVVINSSCRVHCNESLIQLMEFIPLIPLKASESDSDSEFEDEPSLQSELPSSPLGLQEPSLQSELPSSPLGLKEPSLQSELPSSSLGLKKPEAGNYCTIC